MRCVDVKSLEKLFRKNCNMSLVAYGISDNSGSEEETETDDASKLTDVEVHEDANKVQSQTVNTDSEVVSSGNEDDEDIGESGVEGVVLDKSARIMKLPEPKSRQSEVKDVDEDEIDVSGGGLFSSLPAPKITSKLALEVEEQPIRSQLLGKKETVKITVPSLSEFKDDDAMEPERKRLKPSSKGSGLFALLPAPKNMTVKEAKRSLLPNVLTKKPAGITVNPAPSVTKRTETPKPPPPLSLTSYEDSGDEMEGGEEGDFFSLNHEPVAGSGEGVDLGLPVDAENVQVDVMGSDVVIQSAVPESTSQEQESHWPTAASLQVSTDEEPKPLDEDQQDLLLNKEAMERLCGRRAARDKAAMQFIEVSGDTLMPDPKEWLTKQLTEEQRQKSHSHRKNDGPTTQQKRKHQITYLAFQAKENELELKNQWSQNRMSRKQTQSKYGF